MPKAQTETGANSTKHLVLTDRYMKAEWHDVGTISSIKFSKICQKVALAVFT